MTGEAMAARANRRRQTMVTSKLNGTLDVLAAGASHDNRRMHIDGVISHPPQLGIAAVTWQYDLAG
jgi:hypothetical protein